MRFQKPATANSQTLWLICSEQLCTNVGRKRLGELADRANETGKLTRGVFPPHLSLGARFV